MAGIKITHPANLRELFSRDPRDYKITPIDVVIIARYYDIWTNKETLSNKEIDLEKWYNFLRGRIDSDFDIFFETIATIIYFAKEVRSFETYEPIRKVQSDLNAEISLNEVVPASFIPFADNCKFDKSLNVANWGGEKLILPLSLKNKDMKSASDYLAYHRKYLEELNPTWENVYNETFKNVTSAREQPSFEDTNEVIMRSYNGRQYAISFIYDQLALNDHSFRAAKKEELVDTFKKRKKEPINSKPKAIGIYSRLKEILRSGDDLNTDHTLEKYAGENWSSILLELSENREALTAYLERQRLL